MRSIRVFRLLFDLSGDTMLTTRNEGVVERSEKEDPAGALINDPLLWTVHPMLHRLRRLHFGTGMMLIGLTAMVWIGDIPTWMGLAVFLLLVWFSSWMTTYHAEKKWTWIATSLTPVVSTVFLAGSLVFVWLSDTDVWQPDQTHSLTFGIAAMLGMFAFVSIAAGPLTVGALVLATFFGAILGTTFGFVVDKALDTNILIGQGVGWVAVAMLALLAWLGLVALVLCFIGHTEDTKGKTKPLPQGLREKALVVGRRVELELRVLFYSAAVFGLGAFAYIVVLVWSHGVDLRTAEGLETSGMADVWGTLIAGLDPAALDQIPNGLINTSLWIAVLTPGYFAFRSIRKGSFGGKGGKERRRQVGILWDIASFWPRWFHPLAPPGYGPRAVHDLSAVIEDMPEKSVLGAHSQGSLIAAVCIQKTQHGVAYITYGSQLGILYPRMFPSVGIPNLIDNIHKICPTWVNLWRRTDPIGGHHIDHPGVDNRLVTDSRGHSGHEITAKYEAARLEAVGLPPD